MSIYQKRLLDASVLPLGQQICIYNDTVATYNWRNDHKVGVEIINGAYANTLRTVFEHFWLLAE